MRLLPMLVPLAVVIQIAMPGTLGTFRAFFQPSDLIQEQSRDLGPGSGRIADLGPSLSEWSRSPFLGQGFGTRVVSTDVGPGDIGAGGSVTAPTRSSTTSGSACSSRSGRSACSGCVWLFWRAIAGLARRARSEPGPEGWLAVALAASLATYAVGMLTFDAFAFIQVTFLAFIMLGFTVVVTRPDEP